MKAPLKTLLAIAIVAANADCMAGVEPQTPPVLPMNAQYRYMTHYFMQWLDHHPKYSVIRAWVETTAAGSPRCAAMTDKTTRHETFYCTSPVSVARLKQRGQEAYLTPIDFKAPGAVAPGETFGFAFRDRDNQVVQWRFITAGEVDDRGSGLLSTAQAPGLQLAWRQHGTVAAKGTAVKIGDIVDEAQVWDEISSPPWFVAYRGTYTAGMHILELLPDKQSWQLASSPEQVKTGAKWVLRTGDGAQRTLTLENLSSDTATLEQTDQQGARIVYKTSILGEGGAPRPEQITLNDQGQVCRVTITSSGAFTIDMGPARGVARGTFVADGTAQAYAWKWRFKSPDWLQGRTLESQMSVQGQTYTLSLTSSH